LKEEDAASQMSNNNLCLDLKARKDSLGITKNDLFDENVSFTFGVGSMWAMASS